MVKPAPTVPDSLMHSLVGWLEEPLAPAYPEDKPNRATVISVISYQAVKLFPIP
ncbi:MAG: hypothetical protein AB4080_17010 [Trichodesmium sp.]